MKTYSRHASSFRDPSGYIFNDNGIIKRRVLPIYFEQYKALKNQNIFTKLSSLGLLIEHEELFENDSEIVILPKQLPFVTYPYEWCFNQYKEAALLTLKLQKYCLENNFSLKDASAFNITFYKGKAVFIDTLSFDFYQNNLPWRGYKQFISHFLGPLVLAHYYGSQSLKLLSNFIDGIPIKMVSSMLPLKSKLNPFLYSNIHLLAKFENKYNEDDKKDVKLVSLSKKAQLNMLSSLYNYIKKLSLKEESEWGDYYNKINYTDEAFLHKSEIINNWVNKLEIKSLIDLGGNDGTFVRQIENKPELALVCDIDNNAVDLNYKSIKLNRELNILPIVVDVLNPSPSIGFNNQERDSFINRVKKFAPDVTLALALLHHMSLSGNIPFNMSAKFFASFSKYLIIEFPKRDDSWVQRLLSSKGEFQNHFNFYTIINFKKDYENYFETIDEISIHNSERVLFLLKRKNDI